MQSIKKCKTVLQRSAWHQNLWFCLWHQVVIAQSTTQCKMKNHIAIKISLCHKVVIAQNIFRRKRNIIYLKKRTLWFNVLNDIKTSLLSPCCFTWNISRYTINLFHVKQSAKQKGRRQPAAFSFWSCALQFWNTDGHLIVCIRFFMIRHRCNSRLLHGRNGFLHRI